MRRLPAYRKRHNLQPRIRFVGVWDTVSAYGGPFVELTRAIDNWIFPLSMPDYRLNVRVECARHALALDDERDAFHPLLWDEVHEATVARHVKAAARTACSRCGSPACTRTSAAATRTRASATSRCCG